MSVVVPLVGFGSLYKTVIVQETPASVLKLHQERHKPPADCEQIPNIHKNIIAHNSPTKHRRMQKNKHAGDANQKKN